MKAIAASYLLPINGKPIHDGMIVCDDDGCIVAVGEKKTLLKTYPDITVDDFPDHLMMPGLVNAHTHLDLLFFPNTGESPQFFNWLVSGWDHRKKMTPADRRHCLEEGMQQLLRAGTTSVGDVGQYVGVVSQAANSPLRMVLFPEILTGGDTSIMENYESAFQQLEEIMGSSSSRLTGGIAPYAAYTLSKNLLKVLTQQSREMKIPLKIHVAESFQEMQFFYESTGEIAEKLFPQMGWASQLPPEYRKTPIQYLESIGFLEGKPTLVGCNHLSETDLQSIAKSGAKVIHSPRSNAYLKLGLPPLKKLLSLGIPVAIGTDGTSSLHSLSVWDEMRYMMDHYPEGERPEPLDLLKMATLHGARALGLEKSVGSLESGKMADLLLIRLPKESSLSDLPAWLVSHVTPREIAAVFIEGKRVKV